MIKKKLFLIKKDLFGSVMYLLYEYKINILSIFTTIFSYFYMFINGIKYGKSNIFYGTPILRRYPISSISIGSNCRFRSDKLSNIIGIARPCTLATFNINAKIDIGDNSGFSGTIICAANHITIGSKVLCGANTLITDFDWHHIDPGKRHMSDGVSLPIIIEDNVWLGINVIVLKGTKIGKNSIIGANSIVTSDIPSNVVAAGNPCIVINNLDPKE